MARTITGECSAFFMLVYVKWFLNEEMRDSEPHTCVHGLRIMRWRECVFCLEQAGRLYESFHIWCALKK